MVFIEEFNNANEKLTEVFEKARMKRKNIGKNLVALMIYELPKKSILRGEVNDLEEKRRKWERKGGNAEVYPRISTNFKEGDLHLDSIYRGLKFIICNEGAEENERIKYSKRKNLFCNFKKYDINEIYVKIR